MKDLVLFAASVYFKQDVLRVSLMMGDRYASVGTV
jgi:hypothetical protein